MKKLILILLTLSVTTSTIAQLEHYPNQMLTSPYYETIVKQIKEKTPQYKNNMRTANPAWYEETMIAFQEMGLYPGVSACFLRDGEVYWKSHHGYANLIAETPITDETAYTVASISKTIMITATMQLYEQGEFELDDDINDHLPFEVRNFHFPDDPITIIQLMTHTSSIQDNYDVLMNIPMNVIYFGGDNPIPMGDFIAGYLQEDSLYFENNNYYGYAPGQAFNYSNVGSCILAHMVELKTGLDFETYCQQNVFGPLGMEGTSFLFDNLDPDNLALPYTVTGTNVNFTQQSTWPIYAIGNLKVSSLSLAKHLGMYMKQGTFNDSVILAPSTIELITDEHYTNNTYQVYMGLIWFIDPYPSFYSHSGRWFGFNTFYGFNQEENYGMIWLSNGDNVEILPTHTWPFWYDLVLYASQYKPFSMETLSIIDEDGDGLLEAGENINIFPGIRNNINVLDFAESLTLTFSSSSPYISSITDESVNTGTIEYLEVLENSEDPFSFQLTDPIATGDISIDITYSWGEGMEFQSSFTLPVGHAEILLVSDEIDKRGKLIPTGNWYREVLDSLGYNYHLYDTEMQGNPTASFINNFPVVIWFTGYDSLNTLTTENQQLLADYLDDGGKLFLSGQNISDELDGSEFLTDYLHTQHLEDTWTGNPYIFGVEDDLIGNGLAFILGAGDGLNNQNSTAVIEPIGNAQTIFTHHLGPEIAATRFENEIFKTVFFAFGFEGIDDFENRYTIMQRILDNYFGVVVGEKEDIAVQEASVNLIAYPNPCSGTTQIRITNNKQQITKLEVYTISGKKIMELLNEELMPGIHEVEVDLRDLPAGVYYCVLRTASGSPGFTTKLIKL